MSNPTDTASAFGREGITHIPILQRPQRPMVGRQLFPIRDLRAARGDAASEQSLNEDLQWLGDLYGSDLALRESSLLQTADEVTVLRGLVWHRGVPIEGTLPPKHARKPETIAQWTTRMARGAKSLPFFPGHSAIIHAAGGRNYYHWTIEIMPRLFALRDAMQQGLVKPDRILLFYNKTFDFVRESIAMLLPDLLPLVEVTPDDMTRLERCSFFTDATPDSPYENHLAHTSRLKTCTGFLSETIDEWQARRPRCTPGRALLISRADAPTRRLLHEDQLLAAFAEVGLERVSLTGMPVPDQMALMADARLVIAPHGAGITNTVYCRPGTTVLELNVPEFVKRCRSFADIAAYRRLRYGLMLADPMVSDNPEPDIALNDPRALTVLRRVADKLMAGKALVINPRAQSRRSTLATDGTPAESSTNSM